MLAKSTVLAAAVHSFASLVLVSADVSTITAAPSPTATLDARQDGVAGGSGTPVLSTLTYAYTDLPYQVYPFQVLRGPQFGFNQCNSTTEGQDSNCQTLIFNDISDFCLWGSPDANGSIGDIEAKVVAWCTSPTHGARLIPEGSITGIQWMVTPGYIQAVGHIKNSGIGLSSTDTGGELDPHGADLQGNPLGGVVYSNGTLDAQGNGNQLTQVMNWNTFVGGDQFCFKACFNSITEPDYCQNVYDLLGCQYNMPNNAQDGVFESCQGDVQDPVGTYTSDGQTITWSMPDPLTADPPYTPRTPASSSCTTFKSEELFGSASASASGSSASATTTGKSSGTGTGKSSSGTASGSGSSPSVSGNTNGASTAFYIPFFGLSTTMAVGALAAVAILL